VKKSEGRIINVSSITALTCGTVCSSPYGASKHALEYFTSTLRMELKPFNVKVQRRPKGR
jgi:NAD(P)-dependent dehydrogenase (short-subunit alcohol dehydrogenase family)